MTDHDQRFKNLLKEFFGDFFLLFFPEWAERFDFTRVEWLDKEVFTDPPEGDRLYLDLVANLPVRQPVAQPRGEPAESWIVLIHVEIEYEDKVAPLRPRMFGYYESLRRQHGLPVLPISLYLRVGFKGVGWDVYEEHFWERCLLLLRVCLYWPAGTGWGHRHGESGLARGGTGSFHAHARGAASEVEGRGIAASKGEQRVGLPPVPGAGMY